MASTCGQRWRAWRFRRRRRWRCIDSGGFFGTGPSCRVGRRPAMIVGRAGWTAGADGGFGRVRGPVPEAGGVSGGGGRCGGLVRMPGIGSPSTGLVGDESRSWRVMRAIQVYEVGGPEVLREAEVDQPR